ncbi:MAG: sigma 54-interacting transcriptional regulator [Phycisphaerales bacterium]|nr:sigma 54-interacting transcriptional regulator [Phycisphaerales bacterium]
MERFMRLLLDVWREACRHIEIRESVSRIAPLLVRRLDVDLVLIRRLRPDQSRVVTVGAGLTRAGDPPSMTSSRCDEAQIEALLRWCRAGRIVRGPAEDVRRELPGLLPDEIEGDIMAGALSLEGEPVGMLILSATAPGSFRDEYEPVIRALLEPFAVALVNDRQHRELRRLREAVEADNRSLLSRLGRQDISDSIIGAESGLRTVMERVELVSQSNAPVLILGETGSGKEVAARAIHKRSARQASPFLRVNCGAIPPELIDSELFGHERGSFTGAVSLRKGWFERADGGTLFLDEVGELPLAAQVRLLRVLQDGTFERVGGQRELSVDVRVVAATNRDLRAMAADGRFREDLWYRIAVFPVKIPPLRERVDDIPPLAAHFALRAAKRLGTTPIVPAPRDNELLVMYAWPGNVRELAAVIERAAILGNGRTLDVAKALGVDTRIIRSEEPAGPSAPPPMPSRTLALDAVMKSHIESILTRTHGRVEGPHGAARLLEMNPNTLRSRMRKLGIDRTMFHDADRRRILP